MAQSFGTSGSTSMTAAATSASINISAATVGDWVYCWVGLGLNSGTVSSSGWASLLNSDEGTSAHYALLRRQKQVGDTTFSFAWTTSTKGTLAWASWSGLGTTPDEGAALATFNGTVRTAVPTPTATPTAANRWAAVFYAVRTTNAANKPITWTPDAATTERVDVDNAAAGSAPWVGVEIADTAGPVTQTAHTYTATHAPAAEAHDGSAILFLIPASSSATDSITTTDAPSRTVALNASATDSVTTADTPTRIIALTRAAADGITTGDTPTRTVASHTAAFDAVTTTDSPTRTVAVHVTAADAATVSDAATSTVSRAAAATDTLTVTDSPTRNIAVTAAATDTATATDAVARIVGLTRTIADAIATGDLSSRVIVLHSTATDGWTTSDAATSRRQHSTPAIFYVGYPALTWLTPGAVFGTWTTGPPECTWITGGVQMASISALSTQFVQVPVTELASGLPIDPTANPVHLAFMLGRAAPGLSDWHDGTWATSSVNGQYLAQVLVGPDADIPLPLSPGNWTAWLKIDADPETVIIQAGGLNVY